MCLGEALASIIGSSSYPNCECKAIYLGTTLDEVVDGGSDGGSDSGSDGDGDGTAMVSRS